MTDSLPLRRIVILLLVGIGTGSLGVAAALIVVGRPDLNGRGQEVGWALQAVGLLILIGSLAFALRWRGDVMVNPTASRRLLTGSVVSAAVADGGLMVVVVGYLLGPAPIVAGAGAVVFVSSILVLVLAARVAQLVGE